MSDRTERMLDIDELFEANEDILHTDNMSGVKILHLLAQEAGVEVSFGETHAAYGLGLAFCYVRGNFAAPYSANVGLVDRAAEVLGCRFRAAWPKDPEEAWDFIVDGIDAGHPVKVAGPEDSVVFGYEESGDPAERQVHARGVGGPALDGEVGWVELEPWLAKWVPLPGGGIYRLAGVSEKPGLADQLAIVARRTAEWQSKHPGVGAIGKARNYGVSAFEHYLADLLDPKVEIPDEYIDCIAVNFQLNAREALAVYFEDAAGQLSGRAEALADEISQDYRSVAEDLGMFVNEQAGRDRGSEEGRARIEEYVGGALECEKRILESLRELGELL